MMDRLFKSFTFNNGVSVKNRLAVAPMTHFASTDDGLISAAERRFLTGRATDFGLFITAATLVSPEGQAFAGQPYGYAEAQLDSLREQATLLKGQGALPILQLHHGGKLALAELLRGRDKVAPSADAETGARALTEEEIQQLIGAFGRSCQLAMAAGFAGVEIHGANNYLIQQFYSGHSNRRTDHWGGTREKRLRFPLAVVDAVLAARGARTDFIVGYRFSPEEPEDLGLTMDDSFALIDALTAKNLQYLHVSLHDFFSLPRRGGDRQRWRVAQLHERINGRLPLMAVGRLTNSVRMEEAIGSGAAEFIALGKAVLANPNVATLLRESRYEEIRETIDPARSDHYGYPERLWQMQLHGKAGSPLPPLAS